MNFAGSVNVIATPRELCCVVCGRYLTVKPMVLSYSSGVLSLIGELFFLSFDANIPVRSGESLE